MTDDEKRQTAHTLLKELESCPVIFDPTHDHKLGTEDVPKIVLLSISLTTELKRLLSAMYAD